MKRNKTRDMAVYLSRNHCGIACKEPGMYFGNVSDAAISMACNRVEKEITQNKRVKGKLNKIKKQIFKMCPPSTKVWEGTIRAAMQ